MVAIVHPKKWISRLLKRSANTKQTKVRLSDQRSGAPDEQQQGNIILNPNNQQTRIGANAHRTGVASPANSTFQIALQNQTDSGTVFAYITGQALNNNNDLIFIKADGKTPYYPPNPTQPMTEITANVSIPLGAPGNIVMATVPQITGGRIWFSIGAPLHFFVNPGPALIEPSVFDQSSPNFNIDFGFCEFTFNTDQIFANITYVDFVGPPIALTLADTSGGVQHVSGLSTNGIQIIANDLKAQTEKDGQPWSSLIVSNSSGQPLRILSPNSGILLNPSWFQHYWDNYVNQVFSEYTSNSLTVDTQASFGNVSGQVGSQGNLNFGSGGMFAKPTSADIFSNSTGPFAAGNDAETNTIIPRLAAAFNRSTLLLSNNTPNGTAPSKYYIDATTNHYARIVHATNLDGVGYAFPYDDVTPDGGEPQEGAVYSDSASLLTVAVGGKNAYVQS